MPESFLGDGLIFEESLPVSWTPEPLAQGAVLSRLNADNHQLLGAEFSLDEVRVHEALKDESPALLHELQRLEYKVNMVLRLTAELAKRSSGLPAARRVRMSPQALEWFADNNTPDRAPDGLPDGATGLLSIYINPALPQPLRIPSVVVGQRIIEETHVTQLRFVGLSDAVVDTIEKLIFRHHRRLVAGARLAAT